MARRRPFKRDAHARPLTTALAGTMFYVCSYTPSAQERRALWPCSLALLFDIVNNLPSVPLLPSPKRSLGSAQAGREAGKTLERPCGGQSCTSGFVRPARGRF